MPGENKKREYHYSGLSRVDVEGKGRTAHRLIVRFVKLLDVILVCLPFVGVWYGIYQRQMKTPYMGRGNLLIIALYFLIYYIVAHLYNGFTIHISRISELIYSQALAAFITNFIIYIVMWLLLFRLPNAGWILLAYGIQLIVIVLWSKAAHKWYFGKYPAKKTVIVYDEVRDMDQLVSQYGLDTHFNITRKFKVEDVVDENNSLLKIAQAIGDSEIVFLCGLHSHARNQIVKYCVSKDVVTYTIPRIGDVIMSGAHRMHLFHLPMLMVCRYNPTPEYLFFKRLFDILLSGIALIILSPLMIILVFVIRSDGGPALYKQERLTKDGKVFKVLKFRSMRVDAEKDGIARLSTGENDPRITKVGRVIRACRFDELPQLLNILKGDMSIVGPRPERPEIAEQYKDELPEFDLRLQCKCGLTGYAQVYGQYNTTPYNKLLMDLMYISNPSLAEDFKICFATVKILFMKDSTEGIAEGQTTASKRNN